MSMFEKKKADIVKDPPPKFGVGDEVSIVGFNRKLVVTGIHPNSEEFFSPTGGMTSGHGIWYSLVTFDDVGRPHSVTAWETIIERFVV